METIIAVMVRPQILKLSTNCIMPLKADLGKLPRRSVGSDAQSEFEEQAIILTVSCELVIEEKK